VKEVEPGMWETDDLEQVQNGLNSLVEKEKIPEQKEDNKKKPGGQEATKLEEEEKSMEKEEHKIDKEQEEGQSNKQAEREEEEESLTQEEENIEEKMMVKHERRKDYDRCCKEKQEKKKEQKLKRKEEQKRLGERLEQELVKVLKKNKETFKEKNIDMQEQRPKEMHERIRDESVHKSARAVAKAPVLQAGADEHRRRCFPLF
jgi:hypothetical protein